MSSKPNKPMDPDALERQLQRDLEIIRKYREVQSRYGGEATDATPSNGAVAPTRAADSLIGTIEAHLTETWHRAAFYEEKAKSVRPSTNAGAVRGTLRRLVDAGIAEKRGDKASGNVEYRRKHA